jgi:preprotein translocase subunit SecF
MLNFIQYRRWFYLFSGVLIIIGLISMGISISQYPERSPVRLGLDFTSGSLFEIRMAKGTTPATNTSALNSDELSAVFTAAGIQDVRVQRLTQSKEDAPRWQVRSSFVKQDAELLTAIETGIEKVANEHGFTFEKDFFRANQQNVSPTIGGEVTRAALLATIIASLVVLGFIVVAFRAVPNAARYGVCAVIAMIHDIVIMISAMSVMGLLFGWEADSLFLTGLLTVLAYSVQDSIVVFDRIRENTTRHKGEPFEMVVNRSLTETLQRSITTQIVVAFVLLSLFLMGSGAIRVFVGILLIGLLSGAYSSFGIAIPLLVSWERGEIPFINQKAKTA